MPTGDSFLNLAEIAIVFAGFAGISMVLGRGQRRTFTIANAARLSVMIELSVCTALVALVPSVLSGFGASTATTWRASSAIAAMVPDEAHGPAALALVTRGGDRYVYRVTAKAQGKVSLVAGSITKRYRQ